MALRFSLMIKKYTENLLFIALRNYYCSRFNDKKDCLISNSSELNFGSKTNNLLKYMIFISLFTAYIFIESNKK